MPAFGAVDLFSGSSSIGGSNLWNIDKNPLNQIDEGIEDVVGQQAETTGNYIMGSIMAGLDAILGIQPSSPEQSSQSSTTYQDIINYLDDFLSMFGLVAPAGGSATNAPGSSGFDLITALTDWIDSLLMPTNMVAPIVSDPNSSGGVTGFVPLENLAIDAIGSVIGGAQGLIDAILASVGIPAGSGTTTEVNAFFNDFVGMFANPELTSSTFNAAQATEAYILNLLQPSGLLAPLVAGYVPTTNIPGLDASKITTGVFANSFIPGLAQTWNTAIAALLGTGSGLAGFATALQNIPGANLVGNIAAELISGTLSALTIPPLDATQITSGQFPQTMIQGLGTSLDNILGQLSEPFEPYLVPNVSVGAIGNFSPNLLANPNYSGSAAVNDPTNTWVYDPTVTHTADGSGSVMVTGNGTLRQLLSDPAIPVSGGQSLVCSEWLEWSGLTGVGITMQLSVVSYLTGNLVSSTVLGSVNNPPAASSWVELSGTYTVPATGVDSVRLQLSVLPACVGGTIHWDDGSVQKTQLLAESWIAGLTGDLNNLFTGLSAAALQSDLLNLVNNLGLGTYSSVNAALVGITARLTGLNISGLFNSAQLTNVSSMPVLSAGSIPGLDASKIISGVLSALNMPVVTGTSTNASGAVVLPDLQTIWNGLVNSWSGVVSSLNFTMAEANTAMGGIFNTVISNSTMSQGNTQNSTGLSNSGVSQTVNFANYANGTLTSLPPTGPGFIVTYGAGPDPATGGSSTLNITGGLAHWAAVADAARSAIAMYPSPTITGFQRISATVGSGPTTAGSLSGENWIIARGNGTTPTDYVYAKFYATGLLSYAAELGCVVAGVKHVWVTAIPLPINATNWLQCGTPANPRQFQVMSGTNPIYVYTDTVAQSAYDSAHQYWGFGGLVQVSGGSAATPGDGAGVSAADNAPPSTVGSRASVYRASTTNMTMTGGGSGATQPQPIVNNFWDTIRRVTADITVNLVNGSFTVSLEGSYVISGRIEFSAVVSTTIWAMLYVTSGGVTTAKYLAQVNTSTAYSMSYDTTVYLKAGDVVQLGTFSEGTTGTWLTGEATGLQSYFEIALSNLSLN